MVGSISPVLSESFDDVLNAVQETARGRWFLEEFARRKKAEDTTAILAAIVKLESAMARIPEPSEQAEHKALEKARNAIARAKAQIRSLSPEGSPLSEEAQLFARLAELSRKAFVPETAAGVRDTISRGVEVALKLVTELDAEFGGGTAAAPASPDSQKFFQQDSQIFDTPKPAPAKAIEPPKQATPDLSRATTSPAATHDSVQRGAKLTINRPAPAETSEKAVEESKAFHIDTQYESEAPPVQSDVLVANAPEAVEKPAPQRIVIIRRAPDEQISVPLVDKEEKAGNADAA